MAKPKRAKPIHLKMKFFVANGNGSVYLLAMTKAKSVSKLGGAT
jgi:hypothetical protein